MRQLTGNYRQPGNFMSEETTKDLPIESKIDQILALVQSMDTRLTALEEKVDARMKETRPIWQGVLEELKEHRKVLQSLERRFDIFAIESNKVKGDVLGILNRVEDLEKAS
jgi:hypothetical protein